MPLTLAAAGEENIIRKVGGNPESKKHLEDLGFVAGDTVTVVSTWPGTSCKGQGITWPSVKMARKIMI